MGKYDYQKGLKNRLKESVMLAIGQDPTIVSPLANLDKADFKTEEYLDSLGLSRNDLKRLERLGLAIRGYTPGQHKVHWILIAPKVEA